MHTVYNLASVPIENMSKIDNLFIVAREITGCHGEKLVAVDTDMLLRGADNRYRQTTISYFQNMLKIDNFVMVAKEITDCYGKYWLLGY